MNLPGRILLVDDDPADAFLLRRALKQGGLDAVVDIAANGADAIAHLRERGHSDATPSLLVIMDLNMPRMNGLEALALIRADARLHRLRVIVLSSSDRQQDRHRCCDLGIDAYLTKPDDLDACAAVVEVIRGVMATVQRL